VHGCQHGVHLDLLQRQHPSLHRQRLYRAAPTMPTASIVNAAHRWCHGLAQATGTKSIPTVRISGQTYEFSTPAALAEKAEEIAGY
jgi:hypothetical protein